MAERDPLLSAPAAAPLPRVLRPPTVLFVAPVVDEVLLGGGVDSEGGGTRVLVGGRE